MSQTQANSKEKPIFWNDQPDQGPVEAGPKISFPELDHSVLELWDARDIFHRTIREREGCLDYVAYDGPPGTNGAPHIGHMMQSALKDLWPRYYTMKGYRVLRKAGWDTHGLPIEMTAEKELGLRTKQDIINYGVDKYIEYCRDTVFRFKDAWSSAIRRIGRFLDTEDDYATMRRDYIETGWWVLKQAWDKGLLYQGLRVLPYSPLSGTTLSAHEVAQGYKEITDLSLFVKFPVIGQDKTYFVAWTTTAWTLLSNIALALNPDLEYVIVEANGEHLILAEARLEALAPMLGSHNVVRKQPGRELAGYRYHPLFEFLGGAGENAFIAVADEYVTATDGTGLVHLAMYGEDDFRIIQKHSLPTVQNVGLDGRCNPNTGAYAGRYFREEGLDVDILKDLAGRGLLLGKEKIVHSYPHNYKSGEPLMYYVKSAWYLKTSSFKDRMLAANTHINWYPEHIKEGRFGDWLENNVDWAISRERFWGTPLPIWTCNGCGGRVCVGSLRELGELRGNPLPSDFDPHKPQIDAVELPCRKCGGVMRREPEVLDCWFDAGIMPWGQWGYPAKAGSEELFQSQYPADYICEAIDQTRGWFYTMLAVSTLLTDRSSFKNVICSELITDVAGLKMSKSRGNVVDPVELCEKYGADAVRWSFFIVNPWTARRFEESTLADALKQVLIPYWNAYSFFVTYARVDDWRPDPHAWKSAHLLDRWILSRLTWLQQSVSAGLDAYDVTSSAADFTTFIDELTNWYIRRSRRRFWKSEDDQDKRAAYQTLHRVLQVVNRLLAPLMPFLTEVVYQNIERGYASDAPDSVHLAHWPEVSAGDRDEQLEGAMGLAREVVSLARSLRSDGGIRVRQPLPRMSVASPVQLDPALVDLVLGELNVKELVQVETAEQLVTYRAKPNLKTLGPKLGAKLKAASEWVAGLESNTLKEVLRGGDIRYEGIVLTADDLLIQQVAPEGHWVRSNGQVTVALDHRIDRDLQMEWLAREAVHIIQNLRKDADLEVTERILVDYIASEMMDEAIRRYEGYIGTETLAIQVSKQANLKGAEEHRVGDQNVRFQISLA